MKKIEVYIKPFEDQATIGSFLSKYINSDTGKVTIGQNQIIYLYELWTTNFDDSTADFQDLVVMVTLAKTVEELEVTPEAGLVGGHFDVGTSTSAGDSTDAHVHEYDDKYNVLGIDAFNYHEDKLQEIDDIIGSGQLFDLILVNASLSPGAQVRINGAMGQLGNGPFTLGNSSGATRVTSLRVDFSKNAIPNGGLVPTETKLVQSNTPGPNGEYRNGALAVQVVALNADGSPAYTVGENGAATSGLLWETTLFWHTDAEAHEDDDHDNAAGKLIRVNHKTGEYESIMLLERSYDSLAAISDNAFYATADNVLYLLDPVAGTETEIGITPSSQNNSLEFAGDMLLDFSRASTALMELNEPDASLVQGPYSIGVNDLRGIVVISRSDEPRKPGSYD